MKDKAGTPQDYNGHDICDVFEDMMFSMPKMTPRGPGGRGCGRGRGLGRGGPAMGRGGRGCDRGRHGRPEPRPDPRQMPFEHWNQDYEACGRGGRGCDRGRHGRPEPRPDPRHMTFEHWNQDYEACGRGGRGCDRGRHGRPDPRPDPRQMPFEHWNQGAGVFGRTHGRPHPRFMPFIHRRHGYGGFEGFDGHFDMPWTGHHGMWGPPLMTFSGAYGGRNGHGERPMPQCRINKLLAQMQEPRDSTSNVSAETTQAHEDTNKGDMEMPIGEHGFFGPPRFNRPPLMKRLRRIVSHMENTNGDSSGSDTDNCQDDTNKETKCESERRNFPRRKCHRAWRRFMRRQLCNYPRRPVFGYGRPQAWRPPCAHPMVGGPSPCGPMVPPSMLPRLHRLLTALESEMNKETNVGKDEGTKTANQESNHEEPTPRHDRLQARLRRLIAHTKQQLDENAQVIPPHHWMMRMQAGPTCWDAPCHMRRMRKHNIRTQACKTDTTNEDKPDQETEEAEDATADEDIAMTSGHDALDDWQDLRQDVDDIHEQEDVAPEGPAKLCQTCGCSIPA